MTGFGFSSRPFTKTDGNPSTDFHLGTPVAALPYVEQHMAQPLSRLGIQYAVDILFCFPRDYEHPTELIKVSELRDGRRASVVGVVTEVELRNRSPGKSIFSILLESPEGYVRVVYYNQPFRADKVHRGMRVMVSGTPKQSGLRMEFAHPRLTELENDQTPPADCILPTYPLTQGIKQPQMRHMVHMTVAALAEKVPEVLPEKLLQLASQRIGVPLPNICDSLQQIHRPVSLDALKVARTRLIFQELLVLQLALAIRRRRLTTDLLAPSLTPSPQIDARICGRYPFPLTDDQRTAIQEVGRDMSRQFPMNRLLQGDVGSGKTVIAQYAILLAVAHGYQSLLMVPTEILARQHFSNFTKALADSRVRIGLLTGSLTATQRQELRAQAQAGEVDVIVGTQALLHGDMKPAKLGLVVIDEQHKFGVGQRAGLRNGNLDPHYLVLSATPIPRTMAMTMFGDLDVSTLRHKPPGRKPVHTYLSPDGWRDRWWTFLRQRLDEGRQAYVVTPRIESSEIAEGETESEDPGVSKIADAWGAANAEEVFKKLSTGPLQGYRIELLHGRMASEEKQDIMSRFAQGRIQVLVSTTVIEVGIDVANATVMTILGGEHFGLAQLHQLRGRVGRGNHPGHVCVFTESESDPEENARLKTLAETDDGFELAEADFQMRGPGTLVGTRQSGMPPMRIADLQRDQNLVLIARQIAQDIVDEDPKLDAEPYQRLRSQVLKRYGEALELSDVA